MKDLSFEQFRKTNVLRCLRWHPKGLQSWSFEDWVTALTGELGELASLLKMRNRERDGLPGNKFSPTDRQIADELADVMTYFDLLAEHQGVAFGYSPGHTFQRLQKTLPTSPRFGSVSECVVVLGVVVRDSLDADSTKMGLQTTYNDFLVSLFSLANKLGVDMAEAVVVKFNEVSERVGFPERFDHCDEV